MNLNNFLVENLCETVSDCSHTCKNSPDGFICLCPDNMALQLDGVTCSLVNPCETWGRCSQKCLEIGKFGHKCVCNEGYLLAADHFTCKSTGMFGEETFFFFAIS